VLVGIMLVGIAPVGIATASRRDLDMTSKRRSRSLILVPIDFSYTTFYRLSIVTFALERTV